MVFLLFCVLIFVLCIVVFWVMIIWVLLLIFLLIFCMRFFFGVWRSRCKCLLLLLKLRKMFMRSCRLCWVLRKFFFFWMCVVFVGGLLFVMWESLLSFFIFSLDWLSLVLCWVGNLCFISLVLCCYCIFVMFGVLVFWRLWWWVIVLWMILCVGIVWVFLFVCWMKGSGIMCRSFWRNRFLFIRFRVCLNLIFFCKIMICSL